MVVEHFPLGLNNELDGLLQHIPCPKLFTTSGLLTVNDETTSNIFNSAGLAAIRSHYQKVLVTTDPKIANIIDGYAIPPVMRQMVQPVGYISEYVSTDTVRNIRTQRGVSAGSKWVVCSAGGGGLGAALLNECERIAQIHTDVTFDIVYGPLGERFRDTPTTEVREGGRVLIHRYVEKLFMLHASADIVVCSGGTNSLIEAMAGGARILSCPVQPEPSDEQFVQAARLARYYPVDLVENTNDLANALSRALVARERMSIIAGGALMFDGAQRAAHIIKMHVE
jgi:predicted glycosyltransferase